jgi:hypothetical protein
MASVERASAIPASAVTKSGTNSHFNLKKEVYFSDDKRLFRQAYKVSLAEMAAIN